MSIFEKIEIPNDPDVNEIFKLQESLVSQFRELEVSYLSFEETAIKVIKDAEKLALKRISTDPVLIEDDLSDCTTVSYTLGAYIGEVSSYLEYYNLIFWKGKSKNMDVADRKLFTESKCFRPRRLINKLKVLEAKIDKKTGVMQSILKYETSRVMRDK